MMVPMKSRGSGKRFMEGEPAKKCGQQTRRAERSKGEAIDWPRDTGPVGSVAIMIGGFELMR